LRAGRLDLLLQDIETLRRYEVELQLGETDESHIVRAIEYWDIERKRYPQYDHCAVLIAEDITSRFLNVISLFHGSIPLVAIKMQALRIAGHICLLFTTVLDEMPRGLVDDDEHVRQSVDRGYWEERFSRDVLQVVDALVPLINKFRPEAKLNYNKEYIGIAESGIADNFVLFQPRKKAVILSVHLPQSDELDRKISAADIETLPYDKYYRSYRLRLTEAELKKNAPLITEMIGLASRAKNE
jgi:predicted transport protein